MIRNVLARGLFALLVAAVSGCTSSDTREPQVEHLADQRATLDQPVLDFRLRDLTRDEPEFVSLPQLRGRAAVLFFLSTQCNTSRGYEGRIGRILADYKGRNVVFLGVRSSGSDTNDATRHYVREKNFAMPVLADEGGLLADYFGVSNTPTFIVIDPRGRMRYWGALDDHFDEKRAKRPFLRLAIDATLAGREIATKRGLGLG